MRRVSIVTASVVFALIALGAIYGCGGGKASFGNKGLALSPEADATASGGIQEGSTNYDQQYRKQTTATQQTYDLKAAGSAGSSTPHVVTRPTADTLQRIGTWFSPAAYAADTHIDEKYLIRTGEVSVRVDDFNQSIDAVHALARKFGGLVTDSELSNSGDNVRSGWITLRVPNTQFIDTFNELGKLGEVINQKMGSEDVSRQYVAAVSRLRNLTLEQETLRKMLSEALAVQRARGLGEGYKILLDTQQRLSEVTGAIEETEDQISAFADKITRSTIKVNLTQADKFEPEQFTWGMGSTFNESKKELLAVVRGIGQGLIRFGVVGWLYLLPWILVGWVLFRLYRKHIAPRLLETKALEV